MRAFQLGVIVAVALGALLWSALWVMAQPAPPNPEPTTSAEGATTAEASAVDVLGLRITATVGTNANTCATTNTVQVQSGTTVYYCYTVQHTGVAGQDEALTQHTVESSRHASRSLSLTLNPGSSATITRSTDIVFTDVAAVDVSNFVTWTARPADSEPIITAHSRVTVDVVGPALSVVKTVGQDRDSCGASSSLRIPTGQTAIFCITVQNQGDFTFTSHSLVDTPMGINATFNYTLAPGASLVILPDDLETFDIAGRLEQTNITGNFNNTASHTATGRTTQGSELSASGVSTATVGVGNTTVRFTKTVSTDAEACNGNRTISVSPGTNVYYCALIENTGAVTLTHHELTESWLSIDVKFDYPLRPGEVLRVTNDFLARHDQPIVFGPFEVHPRFGSNIVNSQMRYLGSSPEGFEVSGVDSTSATYPPVPTATATSRPDNTSTYTPIFTNTPTNTPIPLTPTFSPTPTFTPETPTATPTRSYAISLLETPTPRAQSASFPQGAPQQDSTIIATPDPSQQQSQFPEGQQPPVQEPALATATQMAVDATATTVNATSTAVAATATASQLAIDSVAATAIAQSQAPLPDSPLPDSPPFDSPVATPTPDPSVAQNGSQSGLPDAPGLETPLSPEGGLTPDGSISGTPMPGAGTLTVLPPVVTVLVATETPGESLGETPGVALLVVTNTPDPAVALLPDGQRPIVYPTPTPTADYVMAAARTFDVAVTTLGWLWFLVGSLVFFVTVGIVAGLFFRQAEVNRYELPEPEYRLEEEPQADRSRTSSYPEQSADEDWPADLP